MFSGGPDAGSPAALCSIPITIRNFFNLAAPGTVIGDFITQEDEAGGQFVKGFATIDDVALINVEVRAGLSSSALRSDRRAD